jgi:hypothetical protein
MTTARYTLAMQRIAKRNLLITALTLVAAPGILGELSTALASDETSVQASSAPSTTSPRQDDGVRALDGEWIFVEDRTEGRTLEQLSPPMSSKFSFRVEEGPNGVTALILNGHGSGHRDVRLALNGSVTEIAEPKTISRYSGTWKDGALTYEVAFDRVDGNLPDGLYRKEFRPTAEGLMVRIATDPAEGYTSVGLYRHPQDVPLPTPAKATIDDLKWLAGAWAGTRMSGSSIEERWSPPHGGAMLAISRTVNTKGRMSAFEYLRIVERDGGLAYIAQPGGAKGTEFVLTELVTEMGSTRAVFDNPRHDFPRRIVYELTADGRMTTSVGQLKGGTPVRIEFNRAPDGN